MSCSSRNKFSFVVAIGGCLLFLPLVNAHDVDELLQKPSKKFSTTNKFLKRLNRDALFYPDFDFKHCSYL